MRVTINGWSVSTEYNAFDSDHPFPFHRHKGIDLAVPMNTPLPSLEDGIVTSITDEGSKSFGKAVHIHMQDGNDVIYGHMSKFNVQVGDHVKAGDVIGWSGNSGNSTGAHVHIQVMHNGKPVDPEPFIELSGGYVTHHNGIINHIRDSFSQQLSQWFHDSALNIMNMLNANSSYIITFAIVICAYGMMLSPFYGGKPGKWFGRAMGTFWLGVIWRVIVS
jgi:hypothetical protein